MSGLCKGDVISFPYRGKTCVDVIGTVESYDCNVITLINSYDTYSREIIPVYSYKKCCISGNISCCCGLTLDLYFSLVEK